MLSHIHKRDWDPVRGCLFCGQILVLTTVLAGSEQAKGIGWQVGMREVSVPPCMDMDACENFCHQGSRGIVFVESKRLGKVRSSGPVTCVTVFFSTRKMTVKLNRKCGFFVLVKCSLSKVISSQRKWLRWSWKLRWRRMGAKGPIMHNSEKHCRTPGRDIGSRSRTRRGRFLPCAVLD